jgi:Ca-activated chloride channel family protein
MDLLGSTVASEATLEVVPAPGVQIVGVDGSHFEWAGRGAADIPVGALFPGQHREALVHVHVDPSAAGTQRVLASVRLKFHDPMEGGVERVQEVLARVSTTEDAAAVAMHSNQKTHAMMAVFEAAKTELQAAQALSAGNFAEAQTQLASVEESLRAQAAATTDTEARARLTHVAQSVAGGRAAAAAAPKAAPSAVRGDALDLNKAAMGAMGY